MYDPKKTLPGKLCLVTLHVAGGIDVFTRHEYCDIVTENLNKYVEHKDLFVYEYVLMPGYLQMIAQCNKRHLSKVLRDFKTSTAREILRSIAVNPQENRKEWLMRTFQFFTSRYQNDAEHHFWQFGNNPVDLEDKDMLKEKAVAVINVPVTSKVVDEPRHYIYSSANPNQVVKLAEWE